MEPHPVSTLIAAGPVGTTRGGDGDGSEGDAEPDPRVVVRAWVSIWGRFESERPAYASPESVAWQSRPVMTCLPQCV